MELKPQEQVKLNDFQAHLQNLRVETDVANKDLEQVLAQKTATEQSLNGLRVEINSAQTKLNELVSSINVSTFELQQLAQRKRDLIADQAAASFKHSDTVAALVSREEQLKGSLSVLQRSERDASTRKTELESLIKTLEERIEVLKGQVNELTESVHDLEHRQTDAERVHAEWLKSADREQADLTKKIGEAHQALIDEMAKLDDPHKALDEREAALAKEEKNFAVMKARMKKQFEKMYPGQTLKI